MTPASGTQAVIYTRCSTELQGDSGLGLEAQESACRALCESRGWPVVDVVRDVISGRARARPGLDRACEIARERGGVLVARRLDRIGRSAQGLARTYDDARESHWRIVLADQPELDPETPTGRAFVGMLAVMAQLEADLISERICEALAAKRARGEATGGACVRRGRVSPEAVAIIRESRARGETMRATCRALDDAGIAPPRGKAWRPSGIETVWNT